MKKQRRGLQEEEKRLLQTAGSTETPTESFENPLPGSENWSNEEIETAITDFQVLYDKVDNLLSAYTAKAEVKAEALFEATGPGNIKSVYKVICLLIIRQGEGMERLTVSSVLKRDLEGLNYYDFVLNIKDFINPFMLGLIFM